MGNTVILNEVDRYRGEMKKKEFETYLGRDICDQTWYRINAKLKLYGLRKTNYVEYTDALELLAKLSQRRTKRIDLPLFCNVWELLKGKSTKLPNDLKGKELREYILAYLSIKPSESVFYGWFVIAGCPFRLDDIYKRSNIITVVALAQTWLNNKKGFRSVKPKVDISKHTPLDDIFVRIETNQSEKVKGG